jgi:hypothetical protein
MSDMGRPRSTPIPGTSTFIPSDDMPGNSGAIAPPSPTEFVNGQTFAAPPGASRPPLPGMQPQGQDFQFVPLSRRKRRGGLGRFFFILVIAAGPIAGISIGIWAVFKAMDATEQANDLSDPTMSGRDREALDLPEGVETLFEDRAPARIAEAFEEGLPGEPTLFTQILIYGDYAFATAQDPAQPTHLDQYTWRSAKLSSGAPQTSQPGAALFSVDDIDWEAVSDVALQAPELAAVEGGHVSHIIIDHSQFQASYPAIVRIYVSGARGSGFVEMAPSGEVLASH